MIATLPLATTFSEFSGTREPNGVVRHVLWRNGISRWSKMRVPIQDVALRFKVRLKNVTIKSQITSHRIALVFYWYIAAYCATWFFTLTHHDWQSSLSHWPRPTQYPRPINYDSNKDVYYRSHHSSLPWRSKVVVRHFFYAILWSLATPPWSTGLLFSKPFSRSLGVSKFSHLRKFHAKLDVAQDWLLQHIPNGWKTMERPSNFTALER